MSVKKSGLKAISSGSASYLAPSASTVARRPSRVCVLRTSESFFRENLTERDSSVVIRAARRMA